MIRTATSADTSALLNLLASQHLVTADRQTSPGTHFFAHAKDEMICGVIGLEFFETIGLLRSLVVAPDHRDQQIGTKLIRPLIDHATTQNITQLYLLTTTARPDFERFGFIAIDRVSAPPIIKSTAEFSQRCPVAADMIWRTSSDSSLGCNLKELATSHSILHELAHRVGNWIPAPSSRSTSSLP